MFSAKNTDLRSILLGLFQTEYIKSAITKSVGEILAVGDNVRDVYVLILILSYFGLRPSNPYIQRLAGIGPMAEFVGAINDDREVAENIRYSNGQFIYYSATYAAFVLRNIVADSTKAKIMLEILRRSENFDVDVVRSLRVALTCFGDVNGLFSTSQHRAERILDYYDNISRIRSQKDVYLFWLQFGIAATAFDKFDLAETYFANAYRLAEGRDPFQIDNHFAKFLLKSRMRRVDIYDDFFWAFDEANKLSIAQYRARDEARFPLEVFAQYGDYFDTVGRKVQGSDREAAVGLLMALDEELRASKHAQTPGGLRKAAEISVQRSIAALNV